MYQKIKDQIQEKYYQQNYPNDGQRFVAWYLRNIHLRDMIEAKDDVTDGGNDKQIDAIFIDNNKSTVYIIQGKFMSNGTVDAEPLREVLSSWVQIRDLVRLQQVGNDKLKRKLSEVATALDEDFEIVFELITTSTLTDAALTDLETFQRVLTELSEKEEFDAEINVIDNSELLRRYEIALETDNPTINHTIDLTDSKYLPEIIAGTQVVIAAIPLKDCVKIPGIKDGSLFQKNVRQSLGLSNTVNKGIKHTIISDRHKDFFFFHNGITAICNKMTLENNSLKLHGLSIVNGCQSLTTISSLSETVKKLEETYVLFRFYEIPQRDRADKISINTNSQSAVKPRDLRSNDKKVLNLKRLFEQRYPSGYFITKRGENAPADKDQTQVIDLSDLGKFLIAWHSQRPNISYGETKIFDKYFDTIFKKDYKPENIQALNFWYKELMKAWNTENPLGFNETLLAMKAYAPYHQLYAISMCFAISNNKTESVPAPGKCYEQAVKNNLIEEIIKISGMCVNMALEAAANEPSGTNKVFSPQNWIKSKACLTGINFAIRNYYQMLPLMPGGQQVSNRLKEGLVLKAEDFEYRLTAGD